MSKLLLLALLAAAVYLLWRAAARRDARRTRPDSPAPAVPEQMVGCSECGVNLPVSDAIEAHGRYFCSEEHRRLFLD
jgi:uncharacterized protein